MAKNKKIQKSYRSKKISVFDTVAEQKAANYNAVQKQDPVQRIKETVALILRVYGFTKKSIGLRHIEPIPRTNPNEPIPQTNPIQPVAPEILPKKEIKPDPMGPEIKPSFDPEMEKTKITRDHL